MPEAYKPSFILPVIIVLAGMIITSCSPQVDQTPTFPSVNQGAASSTVPTSMYPSPANPSAQESYPGPNDASKIVSQPINSLTPPTAAPIPEKGKASISGLLYQKTNSTVLVNFKIYLTPGQGKAKDEPPPVLVGPLPDKGDIASTTNDKGEFTFNNLNPGNYFLVVSLPMTYDVVTEMTDENAPLLIKLNENQAVPLGVVVVP